MLSLDTILEIKPFRSQPITEAVPAEEVGACHPSGGGIFLGHQC